MERKNTIVKKILKIILFCLIILFLNQKIFAAGSNPADLLSTSEYTEEFKKWLELSEEEKQKVIMPRIYKVTSLETVYKNPLYKARMIGSSLITKYSLKETIPNNVKIKNQKTTSSCWTFAALSSLETNLALSNYRNATNTSKLYDYSERHMEYATSKTFKNGVINPIGYNREVGSGGSWWTIQPYLTNGSGAIPEEEMQFEDNEETIDISNIQNKTVSSQVYDTIYFANYKDTSNQERNEIMNQVKQHIKNYGSVYACIHGSSSETSGYSCYRNDTGAKYCGDESHNIDHAISIIGWDDNYSIDNFAEGAKPKSKGAWIIRNSWGERIEYELSEIRDILYQDSKDQYDAIGWTADTIPNEIVEKFLEQNGYTIEGNIAYKLVGDNGLMYVSYEDANISKEMYGIVKSTDYIDYDNIYQYDNYYSYKTIIAYSKQNMIGSIFEKGTSTEYLTEVSLTSAGTYDCRVYVNPTGSSFKKSDMQLVPLKAGESETVDIGYHTLEFATPIALTSNKFAVIIELTSHTDSSEIYVESKVNNITYFDVIKTEKGKCFMAIGNDLNKCNWMDLGSISQLNSTLPNGDNTIKAFTTNELIDESLKSIKITTSPTKTAYYEGENFDKTGMVVTAYYNSKKNPAVELKDSDYSITNGTNLKEGKTSVEITYNGKTVNQPISVEKNTVTGLEITNPPTKTEYKEGQNFDKTGMVITATRKNGTKEKVTNYEIEDGTNLEANQTKVTISYEGKKVEQEITVIPNPLIEIRIDKEPNKTKYVVGQDFDKTGMIITGIYKDNSEHEIKDYTIEDGKNLTKEQTSIKISYLGKTVEQKISVVEKSITEISINKKPNKLKYIQNKENLELNGGTITAKYNDGTTEEIAMDSEKITVTGFDNKNIGNITITLEYHSKTASFEVEIIKEEKAENSNFKNVKSEVKKIKAYYFTDNTQKEYTLIEIELKNIERNLSNDKVEYYYYLSTSSGEEIIKDWIKIEEEQKYNEKINFTIDSRKIPNYEEVSKENVLYLYIKEVATKGADQSIGTFKNISIESNDSVEIYIDNVKIENIYYDKEDIQDNNNEDTTVAKGRLPQTGAKLIIPISLIGIIIAGIFYIRYNKLKDVK